MKINVVCEKKGEQNYIPIFEKGGHEVIISERTALNLEEIAKRTDLTIVSVPIDVAERVIKQVAPYCSAMLDITKLMENPLKVMKEYAPENCEIGSLDFLCDDVSSLARRTVIYCPTEREGPKCKAVIRCLMYAGAKIEKMKPEDHDFMIGVLFREPGRKMVDAYALLLAYESTQRGLSMKKLWEISPPLTRILIDLAAKQNRAGENQAGRDMQNFNFWSGSLDKALVHFLEAAQKGSLEVINGLEEEFRNLTEAQDEAQKLIDRL